MELVFVAVWICALGCGLMAGLYFAFSAFIMTALARVPQSHGIAAMQSINRVIQRSLFMPIFLGTTLLSAGLAGYAVVAIWGSPAATTLLAAGLIYVGGMFVCTMIFNVPLNNALDAVDSASGEAAPVWQHYLIRWTLWNHVRTLASTIASALYIIVLCAR